MINYPAPPPYLDINGLLMLKTTMGVHKEAFLQSEKWLLQ
jgi:hypothetical protein